MEGAPPKAEEGQPQCQFVHSTRGQCEFLAVAEGKNCVMHGGHSSMRSLVKQEAMYRLGDEYRHKIDHMTNHKGHFALNEEVGILRMLLEQTLTKVQDDPDFMYRSVGLISELIEKIQKTVNAAMKAEKFIGGLLSREQAVSMMQETVNAIAEEIDDPDVIDRIAIKLEAIAEKDYADE